MPGTDNIFKIFHISDLHLGKSLRSRDLAEDQAHALGQIVLQAERMKPDLVIISGDVFDRSIPSESAQTMFGRFMAELRRALREQARILVIPGNHDSPRRVAFAAELFEAVGIHLVSEVGRDPALVLEREEKRAAVWALPFVTLGAYHEFRRSLNENGKGQEAEGAAALIQGDGSMAERMANIVAQLRPRFGEYDLNILAAHCYVRGAALSESDTPFVGGAEAVPSNLFEDFDYVALGHLHRMQSLSPKIWYSGAPMAMSFGDGGGGKGFLYIELDAASRALEIRPVILEPLHAFRRVRGTFKQLTEESSPSDSDYVEVILTDANPVYNAFNELAARFPNLTSVRQEAFEKVAAGAGPDGMSGSESSSDAESRRAPGLSREGTRHATALRDFVSFAECILEEPPPEEMMKAFESLLAEAEQELA
jgi:exonuclease SbcD